MTTKISYSEKVLQTLLSEEKFFTIKEISNIINLVEDDVRVFLYHLNNENSAWPFIPEDGAEQWTGYYKVFNKAYIEREEKRRQENMFVNQTILAERYRQQEEMVPKKNIIFRDGKFLDMEAIRKEREISEWETHSDAEWQDIIDARRLRG